MISKGRHVSADQSGERNGNSKLKSEDILKIKSMLAYMNNKQIAKIYNVSHASISSIRLGKSWSQVSGINNNEVEKYSSIKRD